MTEEEQSYAEIMHMFKYRYMNEWAPENIFAGKSRVWIKCFNDLVKQGYITRKKKHMGFQYKWAGVFPEHM